MQKYPHIIELFSCTRKIFAFMFLLPINSLISSGIYSTQLDCFIEYIHILNKAVQCVPASAYSSRFIIYVPSFIFLGKLFLKKTPLNLGLF